MRYGSDCEGFDKLVIGVVYVIRGNRLRVKYEGRLCVILPGKGVCPLLRAPYDKQQTLLACERVRVRYCDNGHLGYVRPRWLVPL